ncbi:MAG: Gfo/Idh/MocA family oxidoreductase [Ruminococcaceae bacterium]|nr:Gfo/Idh/MocA family oxidoreductase [Oscillospiraceae bacterium]
MKEIKIGLVGAGAIARNLHLPAYEKAKKIGVKLEAICDIDIERARKTAEKFGIEKYYDSVDKMLAECDLDGIDICTWNAAHVPVCIAAAKAGKHIMCEKPAAMTVEELKELKNILDEKNLVYIHAVPGRFSNESLSLKKRIDAGDFGEIYYGKASYVRRRGEPKGWFTDKEISGGGPILDIGVHAIDAAWYLMGEPKPVRVCAMTFSDKINSECERSFVWTGAPSPAGARNCEDSGAGVIHFENGAQLLFEASWSIQLPDFNQTIIAGTKSGALRAGTPVVYTENSGYLTDENITIPQSDSGYAEVEHFAECIRENKRNTRYDINKAIQMQSILNAIYRSAELGREVTIDSEDNIK